MLSVLLKKQLTEIFRNYFYNPKTNKARSKAAVAAYIVLFAVLIYELIGPTLTRDALMKAGDIQPKSEEVVNRRQIKLEQAQQWVNHFDTASLFMLALLPFAPTSFMHFAFGMSDMDEGHYLRTVLLGKGAMVGMMAVFGQSLLSSLRNPGYLVLAIAIWGGMYWVSKQFCKKHDIN